MRLRRIDWNRADVVGSYRTSKKAPTWAQGLSCERFAQKLNALGFTARRGGAFSQKQVQRLVYRAITTKAEATR